MTLLCDNYDITMLFKALPYRITSLRDPLQRAMWETQWQAQLKKAEADAPLDPHTGKRKIYIKFDCYVRSKIWRFSCRSQRQ